jgi:FKBP-type peptidyl-prolyl cis-trans isomerase (trigger factor)
MSETKDSSPWDALAAGLEGVDETPETPVEVEAPESVEPAEVEEQSEAEATIPAKLSDLVGQVSEETPTTPTVDLAQVVVLPDGTKATLQELVDGRLMRADYTQKTQELAAEKKRLAAAQELYEMLQDDPEGTVQALAQRLRKTNSEGDAWNAQPLSRKGKDASSVLGQPDKVAELVREEAKKLFEEWRSTDPILQEQAVAASQKRVDAELSRIAQTYGTDLDSADRDAIIREAIRLNEPNLEFVFLRLKSMLDAQIREAERIRAAKPNRSAGNGSPSAATAKTSVVKTIEDAFSHAELVLANQ